MVPKYVALFFQPIKMRYCALIQSEMESHTTGLSVRDNAIFKTMCLDELYTHFVRETRRERIIENLKKTLKIKEKQSKMIGKNVPKDPKFYIWRKLLLQRRQRNMKSFERRNITKNMDIQSTMQKRDFSKLSKKRKRKENQSIRN